MKRLKIRLLSIISLLAIIVEPVFAVDSLPGVDLWLPKSYEDHFLSLVEAAKKVQQESDCSQLLNGRLHEGKSTMEAPVFYFRCRDTDRKSFSYEVDMKTMNILDSRIARQAILDKRKALKEEKARQKLKKVEKAMWKACHLAIKDKTSSFNQAKIVTQLPPTGTILDNDTLVFNVNIDGLSLTKKILRYSARCEIRNSDDLQVEIKRREAA